MKRTNRGMALVLTACLPLCAAVAAGASEEPSPNMATVASEGVGDSPQRGAVEPGDAAPEFELPDIDGVRLRLSEHAGRGKVVVLYWYNPTCRFVVNYAETNDAMRPVYERFGDSVAWLAINSGSEASGTADPELNLARAKAQGIEYPVLMDTDGAIGRLYGAKVTPQFYVIDGQGVVRYVGTLDDANSDAKVGSRTYLADAIQAVLGGERVRPDEPRLFGCAVKYGAEQTQEN